MRAKDGVGRYGERVAARHLEDQGCEILARNWRCRDGELDILARDGGVLVVCEVKTRSSAAFGDPGEAVDRRKAQRIRGLAARWLAEQETGWPEVRFDVVCVMRRPAGAAAVRHLKAAF
ncbi:MAG: YraN family protein [Geodermatophilaceae bacterium]|nr:YraN family protein [Geodermatophilaceae bacterium]